MQSVCDYRAAPKVPGINAGALRPSIGCDVWRTSAKQKVRRSAQLRKARPVAGRATDELAPGRRTGKVGLKRLRLAAKANGLAFQRNGTVVTMTSPTGESVTIDVANL